MYIFLHFLSLIENIFFLNKKHLNPALNKLNPVSRKNNASVFALIHAI